MHFAPPGMWLTSVTLSLTLGTQEGKGLRKEWSRGGEPTVAVGKEVFQTLVMGD